MKVISLLLLLSIIIFGASIDTRLYEDKDKIIYFDEIQKQLDKDALEKLKDSSQLKDEMFQLSRVREASQKVVQLEPTNLKDFDNKEISSKSYYAGVKQLANIQIKQFKNREVLDGINQKVLFLKKAIENITEKSKAKLLSFQLQFAYYKLQQKNIELKISLYEKEIHRLQELLVISFSKFRCEEKNRAKDAVVALEKSILEKEEDIIAYELQKEKVILDGNKLIEVSPIKMNTMKSDYQDLLFNKISLNIIQMLVLLQEKNNTAFYNIMDTTHNIVDSLIDVSQQELYEQELHIVKVIAKSTLGRTNLFFGATIEESKEMLTAAKDFFVSPLFIFNERAISILSLFKAVIFIVLGFVVGMFYKRWIARLTRRWQNISMMSARLISNIGYYLIVLISFIIAISSLGIDLSSLSLIAGALSIGIGFGLQTVVSNLIAGIILMFERTIRIGDIIEINDLLSGVVTDMRIRSTTVKTFDNIDVIVPNSSFIQNNVTNMTLEDRVRRIHVPFGVAYGTEIDEVKKVVLDALKGSPLYYIRNDEERQPDVRMVMMNSSSVDLELLVWVHTDIKLKKISYQSDFLILIYNALRANGIAIPFPQLDVYMKQMIDEKKE